jgi:hypothetical protein
MVQKGFKTREEIRPEQEPENPRIRSIRPPNNHHQTQPQNQQQKILLIPQKTAQTPPKTVRYRR